MSEHIKYEAVFGDQALFDEAGNKFDEMHKFIGVMKCEHGSITVYSSYTSLLASYAEMFAKADHRAPKIAMRRIIKTPVRTKADQQAGKLPEVGCKVTSIKSGDEYDVLLKTTAVIVTFNHYTQTAHTVSITEFCDYFKSIETEAERQQRVRDEWVNRAYEKLISSDVKGKSSLGDIYDALLSGELKIPEVQK